VVERQWSAYQRAVFDHVADPEAGHLVVEALAGSGKTSTIVEALTHIFEDESALFCAFNKSIATELKPRVPDGVMVSTLHSLGLRTLTAAHGRRELKQYYVSDMAREIFGRERRHSEARTATTKLVSAAKSVCCELPDHDRLDAIADAFGLDIKPEVRNRVIAAAKRILVNCADAPSTAPIDFDDMVWLPIVQQLQPRTYDWLFVDETQDLNAVQLSLVQVACGGRVVAVGDRRQAIYLPLSITYRCPLAVVAEAQAIVPEIEAAPNAIEGSVITSSYEQLKRGAQPGDYVISRTNAPLLSLCFGWLRAGVRAVIKGRDIGQGLETWIKGTNATDVQTLRRCIDAWEQGECRRLAEAERDSSHVVDKAACLRVLCEADGQGDPTIYDVLARISKLFGDGSERGAIVLSSTHRAKGLEADRVWLLRDTYCQWPGDEESNLLYVGITRSKKDLIYCEKGD
jgi:superfamily I DNA/RNA helicase